MKKFLASLLIITCMCAGVHANGKKTDYTQPTLTDNGDTIIPFSTSVGTTTAVQVYTGSSKDREVLIQGDVAYALYLSTSPNFTATSGNRWKVPSGGSWTSNAQPFTIYALYESAAGTGGNVIGEVERDSTDKR